MNEKIYCKDCCKEISEEISKQYKGYCKSCYNERYNSSNNTNPNFNGYHKISIIYFIVMFIASIIAGFNIPTGYYDDFNLPIMLGILLAGFISFLIFYMLGTIIQELRNLQEK